MVGLGILCAAYVLSQFSRVFLAVLAPALGRDIGATAEDLAYASGVWFVVFAAMQIPVGAALDRFGPRWTSGSLLTIGVGGGAALFAQATTPGQISLAMALIAVGCAPVLMASYYIFARSYPVAMFATLGAIMIGVGTLGNIAASVPLAWAVEAYGWRSALWALVLVSVLLGLAILVFVKDPPRLVTTQIGSVLDVLRTRELWLIFPLIFVCYVPAAGLRGLWIGPYLTDVFAADEQLIGRATLLMGLAMIVGTVAYGPMDRVLRTRKWAIFGGNLIAMSGCFALAFLVDPGFWMAVALFSLVGLFGLSFPLIMAHGRAFIPPHLTGRGVTLMNLFSIGGVGLFQFATGRLHVFAGQSGAEGAAQYQPIFAFFGLLLAIGLSVYLFSRDRLD